jgi:hypothetical protein
LRYGRLGSLHYDVGMPSCQQKNCCALSALDGNGGGKPRALPWAVGLRPFRPALCGVIRLAAFRGLVKALATRLQFS